MAASMTVSAVAAASFCGTTIMLHILSTHWHLTPLYPLQALLRDLLLPVLWIDAWVGTDFVWRGHQMSIATDATVP
jgi:hypothetical protein